MEELLLEWACAAEAILRRPDAGRDLEGENLDYLKQELRFEGDAKLLDAQGEAVMMDWEAPLMAAHANLLCQVGHSFRSRTPRRMPALQPRRSPPRSGGRRRAERGLRPRHHRHRHSVVRRAGNVEKIGAAVGCYVRVAAGSGGAQREVTCADCTFLQVQAAVAHHH